ncbi:MAG TPA: hypothetical protein VH374_21160 [Polyangia bacterium]|jgi:hypothetical protein|nr:hypothetical protein [Polyangia bacterium]
MIRRSIPLALWIGVAVAGTSIPFSARANPSKQQCVNDNGAAQELRRIGHFADAKMRLERCAVESCPTIVWEDCTRRLDELKMAQPSLVFEVLTASGVNIIAVRVYVDGQLLTDHLDGTPLNVDPGPHALTFDVPNGAAVTERLLVQEGEVARHERVVIGGVLPTPVAAKAPVASQVPPVPLAPPPVQNRGPGTRQVIGLSAAGLGVVGAVIGAIYGLKAESAWSAAKTACGGDPSHCADAASANTHRSQGLSEATVSTTAFVAGAALIAGGAFLYLTGGERSESKTNGVAVSAAVDAGRVGIVLLGTF